MLQVNHLTSGLQEEEFAGSRHDRREHALLTVHDVARLLNCSIRTIYRLCDSGRMPRPVKLGSLVRWPRDVIERWIAAGCPGARKEVRS